MISKERFEEQLQSIIGQMRGAVDEKSIQKLANLFAPILVFHPEEAKHCSYPSDPKPFWDRAVLGLYQGNEFHTINPNNALNKGITIDNKKDLSKIDTNDQLENLESLKDNKNNDLHLTVPIEIYKPHDKDIKYEFRRWKYRTNGKEVWDPKFYVTYHKETDNDIHKLQLRFWFWYTFNDFPGGGEIFNHEGDWENFEIRLVFRINNNQVEYNFEAFMSQHGSSEEVSNILKYKIHKVCNLAHPLIYVALGSHANYAKDFRIRNKFFDKTKKWIRNRGRLSKETCAGLFLEEYQNIIRDDLTVPKDRIFLKFKGRWGRSITRYKVISNAPTGPILKDQWANGKNKARWPSLFDDRGIELEAAVFETIGEIKNSYDEEIEQKNTNTLIIAIHGYRIGKTDPDVWEKAQLMQNLKKNPYILKFGYKDIIYEDRLVGTLKILSNLLNDKTNIMIMGHSLGAWASCILAENLNVLKREKNLEYNSIERMLLIDPIWLTPESPVYSEQNWSDAIKNEIHLLINCRGDKANISGKNVSGLDGLSDIIGESLNLNLVEELPLNFIDKIVDKIANWIDTQGDNIIPELINSEIIENSFHFPELIRDLVENKVSRYFEYYYSERSSKDFSNLIVEAATRVFTSSLEGFTHPSFIQNAFPLGHSKIDGESQLYRLITEYLEK